jgi:hypothetical protein
MLEQIKTASHLLTSKPEKHEVAEGAVGEAARTARRSPRRGGRVCCREAAASGRSWSRHAGMARTGASLWIAAAWPWAGHSTPPTGAAQSRTDAANNPAHRVICYCPSRYSKQSGRKKWMEDLMHSDH